MFSYTSRPVLVVNVGGFTEAGFLSAAEKRERYELLGASLNALGEGTELAPKTMPPFPWHFGGQRFHNLFLSAEEIVSICLDISHSWLVSDYFKWDFESFIEQVALIAAHLHISDAQSVDGKGLQVSEGEIDFALLSQKLRTLAAGATWIPEVWQGHKNEGESFWRAFPVLKVYLDLFGGRAASAIRVSVRSRRVSVSSQLRSSSGLRNMDQKRVPRLPLC